MARLNHVSFVGAVAADPLIKTDGGRYVSAILQIRVLRGPRSVGDHKGSSKTDVPLILTKEPAMIHAIDQLKENHIVMVKGILATTRVAKVSYCTHCGAKNTSNGLLMYINPIHIWSLQQCKNSVDALKCLKMHSEISNELQLFGTLIRDPKKVSPKADLIITQYQIAMNRKYKIRTDSPNKITDYPWVKVYGDNATEDRLRLHVGSEVFIDGCIQARQVNRHSKCEECGEPYDWAESTMEIVPFATEYIGDFYTDEEIEMHEQQRREQARRDTLLGSAASDAAYQPSHVFDQYTDEELEAGIDSVND